MQSTRTKVAAGGAGAMMLAVTFLQPWEGLWTTAKVDRVGTGQPVTVCYGATKAEIPNLKVGQKFTQKQCADLLLKSLPKYKKQIAPCIHVALPDASEAAFLSAAYNAGGSAVCKSPMAAKANEGDLRGACEAFRGWYVHARGRLVQGLVNRRNGEANLCLSGLNKPTPTVSKWAQFLQLLGKIFNAFH